MYSIQLTEKDRFTGKFHSNNIGGSTDLCKNKIEGHNSTSRERITRTVQGRYRSFWKGKHHNVSTA